MGPQLENWTLTPAPVPNQGGNCEITGKSDADDFRRLLAAMEVLGFTSEDQDSIFRILASILHLGNVYFEKHEVRGAQSLLKTQQSWTCALPPWLYNACVFVCTSSLVTQRMHVSSALHGFILFS